MDTSQTDFPIDHDVLEEDDAVAPLNSSFSTSSLDKLAQRSSSSESADDSKLVDGKSRSPAVRRRTLSSWASLHDKRSNKIKRWQTLPLRPGKPKPKAAASADPTVPHRQPRVSYSAPSVEEKNEVDLSIAALENLAEDLESQSPGQQELNTSRIREQVLNVIFLLRKFQVDASVGSALREVKLKQFVSQHFIQQRAAFHSMEDQEVAAWISENVFAPTELRRLLLDEQQQGVAESAHGLFGRNSLTVAAVGEVFDPASASPAAAALNKAVAAAVGAVGSAASVAVASRMGSNRLSAATFLSASSAAATSRMNARRSSVPIFADTPSSSGQLLTPNNSGGAAVVVNLHSSVVADMTEIAHATGVAFEDDFDIPIRERTTSGASINSVGSKDDHDIPAAVTFVDEIKRSRGIDSLSPPSSSTSLPALNDPPATNDSAPASTTPQPSQRALSPATSNSRAATPNRLMLRIDADTSPRASPVLLSNGSVSGVTIQSTNDQHQQTDVDRILLSSDLLQFLHSVNNWSFDIFRLCVDLVPESPLLVLTTHLFQSLGLFEKFAIPKRNFYNFMRRVDQGYLANAYHNKIHAADVVQNMYVFLRTASLSAIVTPLDVFAGLIAAAVHDLGHPGTNNQFQIAINSELAIRYNDRSVLENFHLAQAFNILRDPECDIMAGLRADARKELRENIIVMVLATDMQVHLQLISEMQSAIDTKREKNQWFDGSRADTLLCLKVALHCADVANPTKPLHLYTLWVDRIVTEWYQQGDEERRRGLPVSPLMDRDKPNTAKSQVGFINFFVKPLFETWLAVLPETKECMDHLLTNRSFYESLVQTNAAIASAAPAVSASSSSSNSAPSASAGAPTTHPSSSLSPSLRAHSMPVESPLAKLHQDQ